MHVRPTVQSMYWFVFDLKWVAANEFNSVWSLNLLCATPKLAREAMTLQLSNNLRALLSLTLWSTNLNACLFWNYLVGCLQCQNGNPSCRFSAQGGICHNNLANFFWKNAGWVSIKQGVILIIFVGTASIHNARLSHIHDVRSPLLGEVHAVPQCRFVPSSVYMWWDHCAMPPVSPAIVHLAVLSTPDSPCMSVLIIEKINKYHNYFVLYVSLLILDTEGISISYISKLRKLSN